MRRVVKLLHKLPSLKVSRADKLMCSLIANDATPKQTDEENCMPFQQFDLMTPYILILRNEKERFRGSI